MTENELVQKLHDMREEGRSFGDDVTAMMHVFGIIFDADISACSSNAAQLARAYEVTYGTRIGSPGISDGRKLRRFVTVNENVLRRWRP